jgi:hypothetical protein
LTACFSLTTPTAKAGVTTLDDLLKGASMQVGDLVFTNFGNFSSVGFLGGKPVDPKLVSVVPTFFNGSPGLLFQSPSQFLVMQNQQQETHFTFNVVATAGMISGAALSFTAASFGGGMATIAESVTNLQNGLLVSTLIPNNYAHGQLTAPLASILVSKDIALVGGSAPNALTFLSDFSQHFDRTSGAVPEPASITLLGTGIVGLIAIGARQKRRRLRNAVS